MTIGQGFILGDIIIRVDSYDDETPKGKKMFEFTVLSDYVSDYVYRNQRS